MVFSERLSVELAILYSFSLGWKGSFNIAGKSLRLVNNP